MEPRTVRNFRLVEPIGSGGMGVIYRAVQVSLDRPVAIKELHAHLAKDADFIRRFEREAKSAAALHHENIVSVIDFGQEGSSYFLALEFVDGGDLKSLVPVGTKVPLPAALTIADDVLKGLEHAHARGVVHRDIKPANIMVDREGVAKVADFSIARAVGLPSLTVTGETLGTPAYMSPEQAEGKGGDPRGDLFSVGVILFEMIAGRRPFEGESYPSVLTKLLTTEAPRLSEIDPQVPPGLSRLVSRALEKQMERRFADATEFRSALLAVATSTGIPLGRSQVAAFMQSPRESSDRYRAATSDPSQSLVGLKSQSSRLLARRSGSPVVVLAAGAVIAVAAVTAASWGFLFPPAPLSPEPSPAPSVETLAGPEPSPLTSLPGAIHQSPSPRPTLAATPSLTPTPSLAPTQVPTPADAQEEEAALDPETGDVGLLKIAVPPETWAEVWIDGSRVDTTPLARAIQLPSGPHLLSLKREGWETWEETVQIHRGKILTRRIELKKAP